MQFVRNSNVGVFESYAALDAIRPFNGRRPDYTGAAEIELRFSQPANPASNNKKGDLYV